jgi:hypothetical protein
LKDLGGDILIGEIKEEEAIDVLAHRFCFKTVAFKHSDDCTQARKE